MSIKKLFDSNKSDDILTLTNLEEEVVKNAPELESADNVREQIERINRFIPQIDYSDPNNFVVYGSAQAYYEDAISRIYREFPYDGTEEETTRFHNESTYLDLYVFDKKYPRTTGYAILSADGWGSISNPGSALTGGYALSDSEEYIKIFGGPHTASGGMVAGSLATQFTGANYYDTDIYTTDGTLALDRAGTRESNLRFDLSKGVTTEFWFNKGTAGCAGFAAASATFVGTADLDDEDDTSLILTNADGSTVTFTTDPALNFGNVTADIGDVAATATFVGTADLAGADGTNLILTNADGSTVTFHTDPAKNYGDTSSDGGDHTWIVNTGGDFSSAGIRKATQAFHIACLTAIAAGELDMTAVPATDTGTQTSFTLTQTTAGTAGNTAITLVTGMTANGETAFTGGIDQRWRVNTGGISGGSEIRKATQAFHIACLGAIAAGELDMTAVPATDTGTQTSFTLTQTTAGTAGNTDITLITGMTANGETSFLGGTPSICVSKQVLFDLWNGEASSSAGYGRLLVGYSGSTDGEDPFYAHLASGSNAWDMTFGGSTVTTASLKDTWNHIGFTFFSSSADAEMQSKFYYNGRLQETTGTSHMDTFGEVTGSLIGYIGALQTNPSGNAFDGLDMATYGKLSGSLDEFRYWKTKRSEKDIQNNWWTQVRGGTNNEIANAELGVYYKFNEGITGTSSTDSIVLDYSGRISNGSWAGYPGTSSRNTGSAIVSASVVVSGTVEYLDPIIYSYHPDVITLYSDLSATGSVYDYENNASILDSIPAWIVEEDEAKGSSELKNLTQIVGSYFDTLNSQIKSLSTLADKTYLSASNKPTPFMRNLLSSRGMAVPEIFVDADLLERFANRRDDRGYSLDINDVKNLIYQNIYNNLNYLYKSKGTEKAFRNLIRCYGIGEEIVKFNAYGNNTTFTFADTDYEAISRKKYIDFNDPHRFNGVVYQKSSSTNSETAAVTYISGTSQFLANTAEVEIVFPKKFETSNPQHFHTPFLSASIFGFHTASDSPSDFDWPSSGNDYNFQLYAVRTDYNSKDVYFRLKDRKGGFDLTSSVYSNVYDNQKWNFAVRVKDKFWPYARGITGSTGASDIVVDWYGVNTELGVVKNEFSFTASSLNIKYLTQNRRYYVGADRTNYTGSVVTKTDIRASSVRHWATYLENEVIVEHAKDPDNIGTLHPSRNALFMVDTTTVGVDNVELPEAATLSLNWDFAQVTGSDSSGEFTVEDASSGSAALRSRYPDSTNISTIVGNQYMGRGYFPDTVSSTTVINKDYVPVARQRLPEVVNSNDAVKVLSRDDELYPRDPSVSQVFFAFEKSMYGIISQEMVNMFATIVEFNNLIGEVTNKYRGEYKDLRRLRNLFFEKIQNNPDLDKFIDYYKWIDSSIIIFLQQLVPASANVSDEIRTMIEDHLLGRNKYRHQYPMLDYKGNERWGADEDKLEARVKGIEELTYNWEFGHAPVIPEFANNYSIAFNGTNAQSQLVVSDAANLSFGADGTTGNEPSFSISGWIKPTGLSQNFGIVSKIATGGSGEEYFFGNLNLVGLTFLIADGAGFTGDYIAQSNITLTTNVWQHVVATYDGSQTCGGMKVYINGVDNSNAGLDPGSYSAMSNSSADLVIGRKWSGLTTNVGTGFLDEIALFNKELSSTEVSELYNSAQTFDLNTFSAKSNIVSWWRMGDKATGTAPNYTIPDQIGSNDAAMTAFQGDSTSGAVADAPTTAVLREAENSFWWKNRAERSKSNFNTDATIDTARQSLNDIILSFNSASVDLLNDGRGVAGTYAGSTYAIRQLTKAIKLTPTISKEVRGGYNFPRGQKPDFVANVIKAGKTTSLTISKGTFKDVRAKETGPPILQKKRKQVEAKTDNSAVSNDYLGDGKAEIYAPVVQYSSSVTTGYASSTDNVEYAGYHTDGYGFNYEVPMQGPFTEAHVGGLQHRHIDLNSGTLDTSVTRPEAWNLDGTNHTVFKARTSMHRPPAYANYRRDGYAKRPVNIKNIQHTTASQKLGNFSKNYEVVQTSDRRANNLAFVASGGFSTASTTTRGSVDGLIDYKKPVRKEINSVIVERFSAPGGPEVAGDNQGGAGLDYESGQYSPYNNLNYRNMTVRNPLATLLKEHSAQFGLRSGSSVSEAGYTNITASYHKVNRNGIKKLIYSNNETGPKGTVGTSSGFDNYYVQHMIPRTDYQYAWITASYETSSANIIYGYLPYSGIEQKSSRATTIIEVADGDAVSGMAELEHVTLTSADGTTRRYVIINDNATAVTLGTILEEGSDYGSDTLDAGDDAIGGIAVPVYLTGVVTKQTGFLHLIKEAIEHANGHNGKILCSVVPDEADGALSITLTQATIGESGNRPIISDISQINFGQAVSEGRRGNLFSGGRDKHEDTAINFVTASFASASAEYPPVDFVGMNTTIREEFHPASFILSSSDGNPTRVDFSDASFASGNALFSHRGYTYGYPTWKQLRVGETALPRYYRKNNLYTHTPDRGGEITVNIPNGTRRTRHRRGSTLMVSQSAITSKYYPIVHELIIKSGKDKRGNDKTSVVVVQTSFANNQILFENTRFSDELGVKIDLKDSAYKQLLKSYQGKALDDPSSPIVAVKSIRYKEAVYPSTENMYTNKIRGRTSYENSFWRDSRTDRTALAAELPNGGKKPHNSMDKKVSQSAWPLDADEEFATHALLDSAGNHLYPTGGIDGNDASGFKPGELQNKYVHFVQRLPVAGGGASGEDGGTVTKTKFRAGALYARKHVMPYTGSIAPVWGMLDSITIGTLAAPARPHLLKTSSVGSGEAFWDAPTLAGRYKGTASIFVSSSRYPFYDTYAGYFTDIRSKGKSFSIIPEFRITEHLEFYQSSSDFLAENLKFLTIAGVPSASSIPQNSDEDNFFKIFTNSDFMKYFEILEKDHKGANEPKSITLKCKTIKKFVPYDGFYPAERSVQMAAQFSKSVGPNLNSAGGDKATAGVLRTFLKPFFAPGILYNTIKSGLAVDYPIMTGSFRTAALYNATSAGTANERYVTTASYAIMSNSRSQSFEDTSRKGSFHGSLIAKNHTEGWDYRIPFEALLEPERYISNKTIVDDDPTTFGNTNTTASWTGEFADDNYKQMMHNFLAESMNFFLKKGRPTQITSAPQSDFLDMVPNQPYGMRIKLYRSLSSPNPSSGLWGDFPLPQNLSGSASSSFEMYSRPSAFGPPVATRKSLDTSANRLPYAITGANEFSPAVGVYASHTPPYYDGESWVDIVFYPWVTYDPDVSPAPAASFKPNLKQLQTKAPIPNVHEARSTQLEGFQSRIGQFGTYVIKWRFDQQVFVGGSGDAKITDNSTYWKTGSANGPMAGPFANRWAMQGDASLNLFERTRDGRWKIQTKFETPMLNFKYLAESDLTLPANAGKATVPRGMWHQFGRLPREDEGVFMQITDIPDNWLENHPSGTVIFDAPGQFGKANRFSPSTNQEELIDDAAAMSGYRLPVDLVTKVVDGTDKAVSPPPLSLVDICGFSTDPVRIGEINEGKKVSEAIVAVPFYEVQGERKFFKIINPRDTRFDRVAGASVKRQVSLMRKYIFPPFLDFVKYATKIDPVAMYIFEFTHTFKKDDLSHIWQNLSPKIGVKAVAATSVVTHPLLANELIGDSNDALMSAEARRPVNKVGVKKNLQWMVFKVKQRAATNYFTQIGAKKKASKVPEYTHNWPYDFFSLIELVQIDAEVQFGGSISNNPKKIKSEFKARAQTGRQVVANDIEPGQLGDLVANTGGGMVGDLGHQSKAAGDRSESARSAMIAPPGGAVEERTELWAAFEASGGPWAAYMADVESVGGSPAGDEENYIQNGTLPSPGGQTYDPALYI